MTIEILMPALSPTMTEGNLVKWCKKEGDSLKSGEVIAEIETDKATMEVEAVDEGTLGRILIPEGTEGVKVNTPIALILEEGETPAELDAYKGQKQPTSPASNEVPPPLSKEPIQDIKTPTTKSERIIASPLARKIATQKNLNLSKIEGSGPRGRIVKHDVESSLASPEKPLISKHTSKKSQSSASTPYVEIPLTTMRKVVAKRLTESKQTVPHFYVNQDIELDKLLALRSQLNANLHDHKVSVNDFLIKACGHTLMEVQDANVSWMENHIRQYTSADISVATSIDGGLITPIVKDVQTKTLLEISYEMKDLKERAQASKLAPHEFQGGSFSLSNMGMYGIPSFSAIINPPQGCILAVGAANERAVVKNGALSIATVMTVTLSVDHRAVDGAVAALFLKDLKKRLENPVLILA